MVVERTGSEDTMSPFRLQVMDRGWSPRDTTQSSCANSPWFTTALPKENGTMSGFSVIKIFPASVLQFTIDSKLS